MCFFSFACSVFGIVFFNFNYFSRDMSLVQEVTDILSEAAGVPTAGARDNMDMALRELTRLMSASGDTMFDICLRAEAAVTSVEARAAFKLSRQHRTWCMRACYARRLNLSR